MLPGLARLLAEVHIAHADPSRPTQRVERLPDGTTALMWHGLAGGPRLVVAGPHMRARFKTVPRAPSVTLLLRPGAASTLFDLPMGELAGRYVLLDALWGDAAARLVDELSSAGELERVAERLGRALYERASARAESSTAGLARRAVGLMRRAKAPQRVDELAAELGVTPRHLHRSFALHVGVSPKQYARIVRLQRALACGGPWPRVARAAGYYDQAHMIAEFREMLGVTPEAYRRGGGGGAALASRRGGEARPSG